MNKKYEQMVKFNMSMVRYYADKCGTIGLYHNNGKPMRILNPIAIDNLLKHRTLEIKKQNVKDKINELNEDFV